MARRRKREEKEETSGKNTVLVRELVALTYMISFHLKDYEKLVLSIFTFENDRQIG